MNHVSDGVIQVSTILDDLTRNFHQVLSPSCIAEDCLDRGCPRLQLVYRPRARRYVQKEIFEQLTIGMSRCVTKPVNLFWTGWPVNIQDTGGAAVTLLVRNFCTSCEECGECCHCRRTPTSFRQLLLPAMPLTRRQQPLPGRPCPLNSTILHAANKDNITGDRTRDG